MNLDSEILLGIAFVAGIAIGWLLRGGQKPRLEEPRSSAAPAPARSYRPAGSADTDAEVLRLLKAGDKIGAIKRYRELTGMGLKESKDAIDVLDQ